MSEGVSNLGRLLEREVIRTGIYSQIKEQVSTRAVAEHYGYKVSRNGMMCCPFHKDKTPSMKVDQNFICFGCQEKGDVIDFAAKLFGLPPYEAAGNALHAALTAVSPQMTTEQIREMLEVTEKGQVRNMSQTRKRSCIMILFFAAVSGITS